MVIALNSTATYVPTLARVNCGTSDGLLRELPQMNARNPASLQFGRAVRRRLEVDMRERISLTLIGVALRFVVVVGASRLAKM